MKRTPIAIESVKGKSPARVKKLLACTDTTYLYANTAMSIK